LTIKDLGKYKYLYFDFTTLSQQEMAEWFPTANLEIPMTETQFILEKPERTASDDCFFEMKSSFKPSDEEASLLHGVAMTESQDYVKLQSKDSQISQSKIEASSLFKSHPIPEEQEMLTSSHKSEEGLLKSMEVSYKADLTDSKKLTGSMKEKAESPMKASNKTIESEYGDENKDSIMFPHKDSMILASAIKKIKKTASEEDLQESLLIPETKQTENAPNVGDLSFDENEPTKNVESSNTDLAKSQKSVEPQPKKEDEKVESEDEFEIIGEETHQAQGIKEIENITKEQI